MLVCFCISIEFKLLLSHCAVVKTHNHVQLASPGELIVQLREALSVVFVWIKEHEKRVSSLDPRRSNFRLLKDTLQLSILKNPHFLTQLFIHLKLAAALLFREGKTMVAPTPLFQFQSLKSMCFLTSHLQMQIRFRVYYHREAALAILVVMLTILKYVGICTVDPIWACEWMLHGLSAVNCQK